MTGHTIVFALVANDGHVCVHYIGRVYGADHVHAAINMLHAYVQRWEGFRLVTIAAFEGLHAGTAIDKNVRVLEVRAR